MNSLVTLAEVSRTYKPTNLNEEIKLKLYKRRWGILFLYVLYMVCNSSQWLQYSIIPNAVMKFYKISYWQVDLTSLIVMICYVSLALPAANFMDKMVSSACSIGVFGFQSGIVVGFFLPPILVQNHEDIEIIGVYFYKMFLYFALASSFAAVMVLLFFKASPRLPPTMSQARLRSQKVAEDETGYVRTLKRLFSQRHLTALFVTTGVNNGCFNALSTLLSQIILHYFPGCEKDAGRIGVTMVVFGMTASVIFGQILDRTKKFKFVLIFIYYMSAVAMLCFTLLCYIKSVIWMYIAAAFVGTFLCGFTAVSFDVATELTFPESELIVGTIMNMSSLLFTFVATVSFGYINQNVGYFWGNIGFVITLVLGSSLSLPIEFSLRRTTAQRIRVNLYDGLEMGECVD